MAALNSMPVRAKQRRSIPGIDMTPMVDLAFLLLTFFVMTTTLMKDYGLEIQQPIPSVTGRYREIKAEQVLNLILGRDNRIYWYIGMPGNEAEQTDFSGSGVRKILLNKKREIKNLFVLIKPSDQSRYQNTIDILDEIAITDIANYSLVSLEATDKNLLQ